jgi:hypothetical protein
MAVYVDPLRRTALSSQWPFDRGCHMYADTLAELHNFARSIRLRREWFQDNSRHPHYDLTRTRRARAVQAGAIEHTFADSVEWWRGRTIARAVKKVIGEA